MLHWPHHQSPHFKILPPPFEQIPTIFVPQDKTKTKAVSSRRVVVGNSNVLGNVQRTTVLGHTNAPSATDPMPELSVQEPPKPVMPAQVLLDKSQQFALPTPLRNNVLKNYLEGYDQVVVRYLLDGFSKGFSLGTVGEIPPVLAKKNTLLFLKIVQISLKKS